MGKICNYKFIYNQFKELKYELISESYINAHEKLTYCDEEGYYYYQSYNGFKNNNKSLRFHKTNLYTVQNIKLWCKLNNKPFELIIDVYEGNSNKLKWKCLKDSCGEIFKASWNCIFSQEVSCGICSGRQVGLFNCLAIKNPELASEWHPTKNGDLTPHDVVVSSNKQVWWKCSKNPKHEWQAGINNRSINNTNCPYCSGRFPTEEKNLLIINPILCEEWNYKRNKNNPEKYCSNSSESVWWNCKECKHEWKAKIYRRNEGTGCPKCNHSKGEMKINQSLLNNAFLQILQDEYDQLNSITNQYFIAQKEYKTLIGLGGGLLSYDFYIPKYNLLIEYQGEQHEKYIHGLHKSKKDFEKQQEHDRRKREYAHSNNINLLEIWHYDFDNIEQILNNYLFELKEAL